MALLRHDLRQSEKSAVLVGNIASTARTAAETTAKNLRLPNISWGVELENKSGRMENVSLVGYNWVSPSQ